VTQGGPGPAPNGLVWTEVLCRACGRHIADEAIERGYLVKRCPGCKSLQTFYVDRTEETRKPVEARPLPRTVQPTAQGGT
jgi:phage FluMu protein Com